MVLLFETVGNQSVSRIIGRDINLYTIALDNLNPVLFHASGKDPSNHDIIITMDLHGTAAQYSGDLAFEFY